jgi:NAD-dependent dihydropyrimidine dehydrogenase PreA subunit
MIEFIDAQRCTSCDICVNVCPTNVFDKTDGIPVIARQADCQTCFLCELYCPADALYVSPFRDEREHVDEADLVARGLLGSYRRTLGWRGIKASQIDCDLSHRLPEPDGTPWER